MGRSPERRAPGTAGGTRARVAGRSREIPFCREGAAKVRERGSATAGAAWEGSTPAEQSSGCARVVHYEARETSSRIKYPPWPRASRARSLWGPYGSGPPPLRPAFVHPSPKQQLGEAMLRIPKSGRLMLRASCAGIWACAAKQAAKTATRRRMVISQDFRFGFLAVFD